AGGRAPVDLPRLSRRLARRVRGSIGARGERRAPSLRGPPDRTPRRLLARLATLARRPARPCAGGRVEPDPARGVVRQGGRRPGCSFLLLAAGRALSRPTPRPLVPGRGGRYRRPLARSLPPGGRNPARPGLVPAGGFSRECDPLRGLWGPCLPGVASPP